MLVHVGVANILIFFRDDVHLHVHVYTNGLQLKKTAQNPFHTDGTYMYVHVHYTTLSYCRLLH